MLVFENILNRRNLLFFTVFILLFMMECYFVIENSRVNLLVPRLSIVVLILVYYLISPKSHKSNYLLGYFICLIPINFFFSINDQSIIAMGGVFISRVLLVLLLLDRRKLEKKDLFLVFFVFTLVSVLLLFLSFRENVFFYSSVVITILLIALLSISFTRLLNYGIRNGNLEVFLAMCSFVISDAVFGVKKIDTVVPIYLIFGALFYYISYFLLVLSVLKDKFFCYEQTK